MKALLLHPDDDVALAVTDLAAGCVVRINGCPITVRQPIPCGHKFALRAVACGELVHKHGQPIGRAVASIAPGEHVHVHNLESLRGRGDLNLPPPDVVQLAAPETTRPSRDPESGLETGWPASHTRQIGGMESAKLCTKSESRAAMFQGYRRKDGRVGVRNHVLVLATVSCANAVVEHVGQTLPQLVALSHVYGCSQIGDDLAQTRCVLEGFAAHPNVGAVLLVGLGCETMPTVEMAERLKTQGVIVQHLIVQDEGGSRATAARAVAIANELLQEVSRASREPIPLSELIVATECGGSDAWSGVTANPAVGIASDLIVSAGGTVILSETSEFIGAEHLLAARAAEPVIARQIVAATLQFEERIKRMGVDMRGGQPTPGNIAGGLTTIEEKSLGAISKGGSALVQEVIQYAHRPTRRGLVIMDTPANDIESITGMVAGGAQVVVFTTGRGSPVGCPIAPVIKVASNTSMYQRLRDDMDLDAGTIISAGEPLAGVGKRIVDEIIAAASGRLTAAERWGHKEFAINTIGPRL